MIYRAVAAPPRFEGFGGLCAHRTAAPIGFVEVDASARYPTPPVHGYGSLEGKESMPARSTLSGGSGGRRWRTGSSSGAGAAMGSAIRAARHITLIGSLTASVETILPKRGARRW